MPGTVVTLRGIGRSVELPLVGAAHTAIRRFSPSYEGKLAGFARRVKTAFLSRASREVQLAEAQVLLSIVRQVRPLLESLALSYEHHFAACEAILSRGEATYECSLSKEQAILAAIMRIESATEERLATQGLPLTIQRFETLLVGKVGWVSTARFVAYWKGLERHLLSRTQSRA